MPWDYLESSLHSHQPPIFPGSLDPGLRDNIPPCDTLAPRRLLLSQFQQRPLPAWLAALSPRDGELPGRLPLRDLLDGSAYYPACRFDGPPVHLLSWSRPRGVTSP